MKTLYLHVGWSKTGTSAIQSMLYNNKVELAKKGVLYPESLIDRSQFGDCSHHSFALSLSDNKVVGYNNKHSSKELITSLECEMRASKLENVIISSELSPFYFDNKEFNDFFTRNFDDVKVIFTVRNQSDYIISLFNQLVKDSRVKYPHSLSTLIFQNLKNMNYFQKISRYESKIGKDNIILIPYSNNVVQDFASVFGVLDNSENKNKVNVSLDNKYLLLLQRETINVNSNEEFSKVRDGLGKFDDLVCDKVLFSRAEQKALDEYYRQGNHALSIEYNNGIPLFIKDEYEDIFAI
ncbi:Sulfotransfer_1 domain-containing protein [Vibrio chagasii]|nr:Sulfotransfer_1 domain-containing protein [Vibrio chagasii]CAH7017146.1 Sulfotransfer_1 domain-containing protein [Vibrio chagasii]CAH7053975.1 Sulfotransfer_1 domain-containing protein [Vibrio chagasii]